MSESKMYTRVEIDSMKYSGSSIPVDLESTDLTYHRFLIHSWKTHRRSSRCDWKLHPTLAGAFLRISEVLLNPDPLI